MNNKGKDLELRTIKTSGTLRTLKGNQRNYYYCHTVNQEMDEDDWNENIVVS